MKKKLVIILASVILVLLLISTIFMKNAFLLPFFYKNNSSLTTEENREIKKVLLNYIKYSDSSICDLDYKKIYKDELYVSFYIPGEERYFWINIDDKFMDTVEKKSDNEYTAKIQMITPNDWCYYVTIENINGTYLIAENGADA